MYKNQELTEQDIQMLVVNTGLTREGILEWYQAFKSECVNDSLSKKMFIKFYGLLMPKYENSEKYSNLVFKAFDIDNSGCIGKGDPFSVNSYKQL